jgi:hypothetical protein
MQYENGSRITLDSGLAKQARKMVSEGFWGSIRAGSPRWLAAETRPKSFQEIIREVVRRARREGVAE